MYVCVRGAGPLTRSRKCNSYGSIHGEGESCMLVVDSSRLSHSLSVVHDFEVCIQYPAFRLILKLRIARVVRLIPQYQ